LVFKKNDPSFSAAENSCKTNQTHNSSLERDTNDCLVYTYFNAPSTTKT